MSFVFDAKDYKLETTASAQDVDKKTMTDQIAKFDFTNKFYKQEQIEQAFELFLNAMDDKNVKLTKFKGEPLKKFMQQLNNDPKIMLLFVNWLNANKTAFRIDKNFGTMISHFTKCLGASQSDSTRVAELEKEIKNIDKNIANEKQTNEQKKRKYDC